MVENFHRQIKSFGKLIVRISICAVLHGQKLEESYAYQVFSANVEEEEAWISEKQHLLSGGDYGDTMAAVQGLLKKHEVFETDFHIHKERCNEIKKEGEKLISEVRFSAIKGSSDCF